ncbi:MAG: tetratricopeptide repeat protein [Anaerolineae bacterium]
MIRRLVLISVLLSTLLLGATTLSAQDCTLAAGDEAFAAGQYGDAWDVFQCVYDSSPEDQEAALLGIGRAALMLNQFSVSGNTAEMAADAVGASYSDYGVQQIDRLSTALNKNPDDLAVMTELAHWLWLRARDDEALPLYEAILAAEPENVFALTFRASSQAYLGQLEDAEAGFEQAIALAPENDHVYAIAATTYLDNGDPERAVAMADQAISLQPDDFAGRYVTRGDAHIDLDDHEAALADYTRALELDPGLFSALTGQADAYLKLDQADAGLDAVDQALELNPDSTWAHILRGRLHLSIGENELALEDFRRANDLSPDDVRTLNGLGDALFNLGEYADAASTFEQAIAADPESRYAHAGLAASLSGLDDPGTAQAFADLFQTAGNPVEISASGKPQTLSIDFDTVYFAQLDAAAGDTISASVEALETGALDPALIVLDSNGQIVAFADNTNSFDAVLDAFVVPEAGTYTVVFGLLDTRSGDVQIVVNVQ